MITYSSHLHLSYPGLGPLNVPLADIPESLSQLKVCGDDVSGHVYGDDVNEWFTAALGSYVRLVRLPRHARTSHLGQGYRRTSRK